MGDINDLRRARQDAANAMAEGADALEQLEACDDTTEDQMAAASATFEAAQAAFEKADKAVKRAEAVETAQAASAVPEPSTTLDNGGTSTAPTASAAVNEKGLRFGAMLRTLAAADGNLQIAQAMAEEQGNSGLFAAQRMSDAVKGGFFVPEDVADEVIELLRPESVVTAMGPRFVPLPNGNLTTNRRNNAANFGYGDEGQDAPVTGYEYGQMKLSAKKLRGIIPISNDLLGMASTAVDRMVRDDAIEDAAQIQDRYFLRGQGTEFAPKGLRFQLVGTPLETSHILSQTGVGSGNDIILDLGRLELALRNANVKVSGAHWIMSPRTESHLMDLRDGNGQKIFPEMEKGMLRNKRYHTTTEIPWNLGAVGNESEVMLVHPRHVVVGEHSGISIAMSGEAAYKDENGDMQSAFSRDETLMRLIMHHDLGLRHLAAVSVLTGVTWGATG